MRHLFAYFLLALGAGYLAYLYYAWRRAKRQRRNRYRAYYLSPSAAKDKAPRVRRSRPGPSRSER